MWADRGVIQRPARSQSEGCGSVCHVVCWRATPPRVTPEERAAPVPTADALLLFSPAGLDGSAPSGSPVQERQTGMLVSQLACRKSAAPLLRCRLKMSQSSAASARPSSDLVAFRKVFLRSQNIVIITGAGVSAESGVPTFRGQGGFWRKWAAQDLATPGAFSQNPSRVWEFYHYRRELVLTKEPNPAHQAIAECEAVLAKQGRRVTVITQNVDELHRRAGSKNLLEIHGSLYRTRCLSCGHEASNYKSPICPALEGRGAPDRDTEDARIPEKDLPRCETCSGLLRPAVVWFGESLDSDVLRQAEEALERCDLCLVAGTSSVVYPAAMFAPQAADRGVPVAEFNTEVTPATNSFQFHFHGPCGEILPLALCCHRAWDAEPEN
ncbi:NAD-dependent protein deacylase sirtuin-5, mitochondrial-like [Neosynchiropus ocellatus]